MEHQVSHKVELSKLESQYEERNSQAGNLEALQVAHAKDLEEKKLTHDSEMEGLKAYYLEQLKAKEKEPKVANAIADMAHAVENSSHEVGALREKVEKDRLASVKSREEAVREREKNLTKLEEASAGQLRHIDVERQQMQSLLADMREQSKQALAEGAAEKARASEEQVKLIKLQATLEGELEEARRQYRSEVERWKEDMRRSEILLSQKTSDVDRERVSVEEGRKDLTRKQVEWQTQKAAEAASLDMERKRIAEEESKLASSKCKAMEEQARVEILVRGSKEELSRLHAEQASYKVEKAALDKKINEVMKLGKVIEAQSNKVHEMHAEALALHTEGVSKMIQANEIEQTVKVDLERAEAERQRVEQHAQQQEKHREELKRERVLFEQEKLNQRRLEENRRNRASQRLEQKPLAITSGITPAPVSAASVIYQDKASTGVLSPGGANALAAVNANIEDQLAKWKEERSSQEQYLKDQSRVLTEIRTNVNDMERHAENIKSTAAAGASKTPFTGMEFASVGKGSVLGASTAWPKLDSVRVSLMDSSRGTSSSIAGVSGLEASSFGELGGSIGLGRETASD